MPSRQLVRRLLCIGDCGKRRLFPQLSTSTCYNISVPVPFSTSAPCRISERKYPGIATSRSKEVVGQNRAVAAAVVVVVVALYGAYNLWQPNNDFIPHRLVRKDAISSTASYFVLEPAANANAGVEEKYAKAWQRGVWNVQFKQPQLQIIRPYTPLPPIEDFDLKPQLRFLIREEQDGEVSRYLHRLPLGSQIELRGPNIEYEISDNVKQIVFFAGGTGIAPAVQVAHALFSGDDNKNKDKSLHILWANRRREECLGGRSDHIAIESSASKSALTSLLPTKNSSPQPDSSSQVKTEAQTQNAIVAELELLKKQYPGQVTVEYFVNEENTYINHAAVRRALSYFDDRDFSRVAASSASSSLSTNLTQEQRQILISGPPGFISHLAGPKEWKHGKEQQGEISRLLAHVMAETPHDVKIWKI